MHESGPQKIGRDQGIVVVLHEGRETAPELGNDSAFVFSRAFWTTIIRNALRLVAISGLRNGKGTQLRNVWMVRARVFVAELVDDGNEERLRERVKRL